MFCSLKREARITGWLPSLDTGNMCRHLLHALWYLVWFGFWTRRWRHRAVLRLRTPPGPVCLPLGCSRCLRAPPRPKSEERSHWGDFCVLEILNFVIFQFRGIFVKLVVAVLMVSYCRSRLQTHTFLCVSLSLLSRYTALSTATRLTFAPGLPLILNGNLFPGA